MNNVELTVTDFALIQEALAALRAQRVNTTEKAKQLFLSETRTDLDVDTCNKIVQIIDCDRRQIDILANKIRSQFANQFRH